MWASCNQIKMLSNFIFDQHRDIIPVLMLTLLIWDNITIAWPDKSEKFRTLIMSQKIAGGSQASRQYFAVTCRQLLSGGALWNFHAYSQLSQHILSLCCAHATRLVGHQCPLFNRRMPKCKFRLHFQQRNLLKIFPSISVFDRWWMRKNRRRIQAPIITKKRLFSMPLSRKWVRSASFVQPAE